jgi:hypothetical protein
MSFKDYLNENNIEPEYYLNIAKQKAKQYKLNYKSLQFSDKKDKKLMIQNPRTGKYIHFGASNYNDYILYRLLLHPNAEEYRQRYLSRATQIKGQWIFDEYSPNQLAINILW